MNIEKQLKVGEEVLIFDRKINVQRDGTESFIRGTVIEAIQEDLSYRGSPWYVDSYRVIGEDNKEYIGSYGNSVIGNAYFFTEEDYIFYLNILKDKNNKQINELQNKNQEINTIIDSLQDKQKVYTK